VTIPNTVTDIRDRAFCGVPILIDRTRCLKRNWIHISRIVECADPGIKDGIRAGEACHGFLSALQYLFVAIFLYFTPMPTNL